MNRPNRVQLFERRWHVARFVRQGRTQANIARRMNLLPATVSRDLAAMREFRREFPANDFEKVRLELLQMVDLLEAVARAAWHDVHIAQWDDFDALEGRLCARRVFRAGLDESPSRIMVCSDFLGIFQLRASSLEGTGLRDASSGAAGRNSKLWNVLASSRELKNDAHKRIERTLMRYREGMMTKSSGESAG